MELNIGTAKAEAKAKARRKGQPATETVAQVTAEVKVLQPPGHMNWWFWGAMGISGGMWYGIWRGIQWLA